MPQLQPELSDVTVSYEDDAQHGRLAVYEGRDHRAVVARIVEEYGTEARIVERSGSTKGLRKIFGGEQTFRVVVAVSTPPPDDLIATALAEATAGDTVEISSTRREPSTTFNATLMQSMLATAGAAEGMDRVETSTEAVSGAAAGDASPPTIERTPPSAAEETEPVATRTETKRTAKVPPTKAAGDAKAGAKAGAGAARPARTDRAAAAAKLAAALEEAGFPARIVAAVADGGTLAEVLAEESAPVALSRRPGTLIAVICRPEDGVADAASAAREVGLPDGELAVARAGLEDPDEVGLRASSPEAAAELHRGWRRGRAGVVGIVGGHSLEDERFLAATLAACRPTTVIACIDATVKTEDVALWLSAIGGADALCVHGAGGTASPGSLFSLGIPVMRLDGRPANEKSWRTVISAASARRRAGRPG